VAPRSVRSLFLCGSLCNLPFFPSPVFPFPPMHPQRFFTYLTLFLLLTFPTFSQSNISGKPGLIYTPTARFTEDGTMGVGIYFTPQDYGFTTINRNPGRTLYMNLTVLPRFDVNVNVYQLFNTPENPIKLGLGDRQLDFRYLVFKEKTRQPSLAVIVSTPTSISPTLLTHAIVATKNFRLSENINAEVSAGYGSPFHVYRKGSTLENYGLFANMVLEKKSLYRGHKHYLEGPFGGVSLQFRKKFGLMLEYDSKNINVGAYTTVLKNWVLQAGVLNAEQITFGTSYNFSLLKSAKRNVIAREEKTEPDSDKILNNFENVQIDSASQTVYYEQRLYRNPFKGLYQLQHALADTSIQTYVPLFQGIPIGKYRLKKNSGFTLPENAGRKEQQFKNRFPLQRNHYKFDFWIQPYFAAIFGNFDKPIQSNTSVALQSQLYLLPGMALNFGILFPIVNDLDNRPKIIRPAPIFLNQFYASGNHFFSASAGFFQNDQYGVNLQYRHANFKSPWSAGLEAGLTGDYYYPRGGIYYGSMNKLLLIADVAYRINNPDLTFKLSAGHYLASDNGIRADVFRQFTNIEIGFYAMTTTNGSTMGFNFAIPIPPGKLLQGKHARLRTTDEFRWEYTYTRGYQIGERYRVGYQLDQKVRMWGRR